jgi:hypothetical protein
MEGQKIFVQQPDPCLASYHARGSPEELVMLAHCLLSLLWMTLPSASSGPDDSPTVCEFAIQHPIDVQVKLLDPIVPGRANTAQIVVESRMSLDHYRITLEATPGLRMGGPRTIDRSALVANETMTRSVSLWIPDTPDQQQLQVLVEGTIDGSTLRRGTALNVLPYGPHHPARPIPVVSKGRQVLEYPGAARRIR